MGDPPVTLARSPEWDTTKEKRPAQSEPGRQARKGLGFLVSHPVYARHPTLADVLAGLRTGWRRFRGAQLAGADLRDTPLQRVDFSRSDLSGAFLSRANLRGARLVGADLRLADLRGARLRGANLRGANLREACLDAWALDELDAADALDGAHMTGVILMGFVHHHATIDRGAATAHNDAGAIPAEGIERIGQDE